MLFRLERRAAFQRFVGLVMPGAAAASRRRRSPARARSVARTHDRRVHYWRDKRGREPILIEDGWRREGPDRRFGRLDRADHLGSRVERGGAGERPASDRTQLSRPRTACAGASDLPRQPTVNEGADEESKTGTHTVRDVGSAAVAEIGAPGTTRMTGPALRLPHHRHQIRPRRAERGTRFGGEPGPVARRPRQVLVERLGLRCQHGR